MQLAKITALVVFAAFATASVAPAQTAAPAATPAAKPAAAKPAATTAAAKPAAKERTALSKDCSAQATAKGLHGKERKKFRSTCKKGTAQPAQ